LVKGTAKGYFLEILKALKESGYRVACRVLDAQWLGVPQTRQRVIFVGVRDDLKLEPVHPKPLPYRYSVRDAVPWIVRSTEDPCGQFKVRHFANQPHGAITTTNAYHIKVEALPPSRRKPGAYGVQQVDPEKPCPTVTCASPGNDLAVPFTPDPTTDISRFAIGAEWGKLKQGEKSDKYLNLIRADETKPSPTICASHGNLGMAGVTHPTERRKFTIAELKRICAFPDDFVLTGSYAQQWERLGNSVPPLMMFHIASAIRDQVLLVNSKPSKRTKRKAKAVR
jgi:DNA (cytosine-5)-methyltransferase 1